MASRSVNRMRRVLVVAIGTLPVVARASSATRATLPGGGTIVVPRPFKTKTDYPNHSDRAPDALIAYRNWDSTLSGHPDCDGMLAVGLPARFDSLNRFVQSSSAALSSRWSSASTIPGQPWDGKEKQFPIERSEGPSGPELARQLAVPRSGWFSTYDEPARMYAVQHRRGLYVAVWLYDKDGGVRGARALADQIAASLQN